jgi:hypothetical protein
MCRYLLVEKSACDSSDRFDLKEFFSRAGKHMSLRLKTIQVDGDCWRIKKKVAQVNSIENLSFESHSDRKLSHQNEIKIRFRHRWFIEFQG